jgi:large subunit ribosomal protein L15
MSLNIHTLAPTKGARTKSFRIGRGEGSGRGKTAGKGTKGQKSRTGGRRGLKMKGLKQMLLGIPKLRGFKSRYVKAETVTIDKVVKAFNAGERIDIKALKAKDLVSSTAMTAKIVGSADVGKVLTFNNIKASATAKTAIEKAGGTLTFEKKKKKA